jgi:branched-chain amino acid transport system ATP-binding protein
VTPEILSVRNVEAGYRRGLVVLRGVSLAVREGQLVALLGSNGAGKSTLLRTVMGLIPDQPEKGEVVFRGVRLNGKDPDAVARLGVALVPEGRGVFPELTVAENLQLAGYARRYGRAEYEAVLDRFPVLRERLWQQAGTLSGGEQQMLAIARALLLRPSLLLLDEPSLGLAPRVVAQIFAILQSLNREGMSILLVEQNARMALAVAHYGYVLEAGRLVLEGPADRLREDPNVQELYLGVQAQPSPKGFRRWRPKRRWA